MSSLLLLTHEDAGLTKAQLASISAAKLASGIVDVLLITTDKAENAESLAKVAGVNKVLILNVATTAPRLIEKTLVKLSHEYTHIFAPASSYFKAVVPRVAALLDIEMVSEVIGVLNPNTYLRPVYAGAANAVVSLQQPKQIITIRPTAFEVEKLTQPSAPIENLLAETTNASEVLLETRIEKSDRPSLAGANIVVTGGRSLGSAEKFEEIMVPLANRLNAAIGATRAAVDAGFAPNDAQVGQTGTVVAPEIYLALGVSGAAQHIAGIKGSKTIIAVNHDPDAQIFQWADYGLVADLFETAKTLEEAL